MMTNVLFWGFEDHLKKYLLEIFGDSRRKFRSQTSDNMDRWKAETGRVREKRRVEERRSEKRKSQKKEAQMREKVGKSRNTVFFQWFVAPEGRKVGLLKRRVRSHLARWEMKKCTPLGREAHLQVKKLKVPHVRRALEVEMSKKCTPLWREAHFEVKMYTTHHSRTTFGSWDVEKVHAVVARSTFRSQNVQSTPCSDHFWELKKVHAVVAQSTFRSQNVKTPGGRTTFGRSDVVSRGRRKGLCTLSKVSKTWGSWSIFKDHGRRGTFADDLQRCLFRGRRSTRDIFIRAVRRSGRSKHIGTRPSALHSTFHFWRKSRRIASFLMLSTSKFVSDVVKFKNWGCLAELLRFWRCQLQTLRTSRRIAAFLMLSSSKPEDVSQDSFVFKLADRQVDR